MVKSSVKKIEKTKSGLRILLLVGYSSGPSGVWQRVKDEAKAFTDLGHTVVVFSSNAVKGSPKEEALDFEEIDGFNIRRFPYVKLGGESYMTWNFTKAAILYNPDIIISHCYRHTHSDKAVNIARRLGCKCVCVTHAPFIINRKFPDNIIVGVKDYFSNIYNFDNIVAISKWEVPLIKRLGKLHDKITIIPNPIPDKYFESDIKNGKGILYLGRFHPIKDLTTLVKGVASSKFSKVTFIGSGDLDYVDEVSFVERVERVNVDWDRPIYDIDSKIELFDKHEIFVLSSTREAMPISLVEAMSRGKIVISSRTDGGCELIEDGVNGFLFDIKDYKQLGMILNRIKKMSESEKNKIKEAARVSITDRKMSNVMKSLEKIFQS